jgi:hypothetical protein
MRKTNKNNTFTVLTVMENTVLGDSKPEDFIKFMKENFPKCEFKFEKEVKTANGKNSDIFFYVNDAGVMSFAVQRFAFNGAFRWFTDVVDNNPKRYTKEIINKYYPDFSDPLGKEELEEVED